ncbi:MAG: hypothetical protein ACR2RF_12770 [Geminicoccaceae bacterium]
MNLQAGPSVDLPFSTEHRRTMLSTFEQELAGAAMINIGRETADNGFYDQVVHLLRKPNGVDLQFQLKNHLSETG